MTKSEMSFLVCTDDVGKLSIKCKGCSGDAMTVSLYGDILAALEKVVNTYNNSNNGNTD